KQCQKFLSLLFNQEQNTVDLPKYKGYVIQFFNPGCEICQGEAQDYFKHRDSLQEYLFLMLSTDSISMIKEFAMKQQLSQSDNFIFGHVDPAVMWSGFGDVPVPSLFLYNPGRKYITKTRITDSSTILGYFNKNKK
ncbi:MAG: redoxin domain-containing protein, partial [Flavobacteriaceae bacterium]|nr:redoxin domain-containing protein [Flavobacteriaceae bacterium]